MTSRPALLLFAFALAVPPAFGEPPKVDYPAGYRQWGHVKSMVIFSDKNPLFAQFGGMHHIYANGEARSEEHTSELQSRPHLVCRLLLGKNKDQRGAQYVAENHAALRHALRERRAHVVLARVLERRRTLEARDLGVTAQSRNVLRDRQEV